MSKGLTSKLMRAYFVVVILPICIFYLFFVAVLFLRTFRSESDRNGYQLELAVNELELKLNKLENLADSIRQNSYIDRFLRYPYDSVWEPMYDYLDTVQYQLHSYINYNPYIRTLRFYSDAVKLNPGGYFYPVSALTVEYEEAARGSWVLEEGKLHYYLGWNQESLKLEYAVEVEAEETLLAEFVQQLGIKENSMVRLIGEDGEICYDGGCGRLAAARAGRYKKLEAAIPSLGLKAEIYLDVFELVSESLLPFLWTGLLLFAALFLLLLIYLRYSLHFARRLVRFTAYIRTMPENGYEPYPISEGEDEIGELVRVFNGLVDRTNTLVNIVQKNEILRRRAELDAYQSKIEPHFLYGTLESLRMLALKKGDVQVADGIFNLARLFRYSLTSSRESTLEKELSQVERYLELRKLRMEERLDWKISIEEELRKWACPNFLLQPIVENSVKHGIEKLRRGGTVSIDIRRWQEAVVISVTDNGAGISEEQKRTINDLILQSSTEHNPLQEEDKGYALYNICMRVKLFYGKESTLRIDNAVSGGTVCRLWLIGEPRSEEGREKTI